MDPDPDSPISRVGRTFWTFWNYITETVNRFLRPEPPIAEINDQNNEHFDSGHPDYTTTEEGEEQRHFAPVSSLSSSRPVVFWNTGSELETENVHKMYKDGEGMREDETVDEIGIDVAILPIADNATEDNQEECSNLKIDAEDVMIKTLEDANIWSLPDEALNVELEQPKQNSFGVEEPGGTITLDKEQSLDQLKVMDKKEDLNKLHSSLGSETEDISKLDNKTDQKEHSDEKTNLNSDDMAVIQSNQGLEGIPSSTFPETLPHVEFKLSDDNCSIVPEGEPTVDKPEHTVADISDDSANGETEKEEKPGKEIDQQEQDANVLDGEESEMAQESEEDCITKHITCNTSAAAEDGHHDNATDLCLVTQKVVLDIEGFFDINDYNDDLTRLSIEKESGMEKLCLNSSVTVTHEGEFGQKEAKAIKNIPPAEFKGQDSVPRELYSSYKESREGVPEHNNEAGFNGSTTQRFLEVGNCRKVQTTLLQEEVESGEAKHLQNSSSEAEADSFEETELMETEPNKDSFEVDNVGSLTEKTIALPHNVMKTVVDDKEFEEDFVSKDESIEKEEHLKEETKEILVEFEMVESLREVETAANGGKEVETANVAGFTEDKFYETEFHKMNETVFLDQTTDENDLCTTLAQRESKDESHVEMHYTGINLKDIEEDLCTLKEEPTKEKTISESNSEKYEVQLRVTVEDDKTMSSEDKLLDVGDHEISARLLSAEDSITDVCQTYKFDQLMCSEVIEDEILDLWIQQTSLDNTDVTKGHQGKEENLSELPEEKQVESNPELSMVCDASISSSTAESGYFDQSLDIGALHQCKKQEQESAKIEQLTNLSSTLSESENTSECPLTESEFETPWKEDLLSKHVRSSLDALSENTDDEAQTLQNIEAEVSMSSPVVKDESKFADNEPLKRMRALFDVEAMAKDQSDSSVETDNTVLMSDTPLEIWQLPLQEKPKEEALSWFSREDKDIDEVDVSELDFTPQKSRIAVKNPRVRPPKDPRLLLHKPSLEPSPLKHEPSHVPAAVPLRGLGIGVKLPGLGPGFPVLKKTKKTVGEETETTTKEMKPEDNDDKLKQEDSQHKPKWLPKQHPGFGNPLMSELKSKLKKTAKE